MSLKLIATVIVAYLLISCAANISARDLYSTYTDSHSKETIAKADMSAANSYGPFWVGMHQTGEIDASFTCLGQFGLGYFIGEYGPTFQLPTSSFISPSDSYLEYLFGGAIWIGGVVGGDTLVSVGADGWELFREFWPPGDPSAPSAYRSDYIADYSMNALFTDTFQSTSSIIDPENVFYHIPLNLRVANRSHSWHITPFNRTIIYDMVVTNTGDELIDDGYVGLFFDADVKIAGSFGGFDDDVSGSLPDHGIAYAFDTDGDPDSSEYGEGSLTRAIGAKFLDFSFSAADTNFNWWLSNGDPLRDFGPRLKGTVDDPFRPFGDHIGTPSQDIDKYYIMRHREWDYDQIFTSTIRPDDSLWMYPLENLAVDFADGYDTRFLLSAGPFDLYPDSSVRILYATFTGAGLHTDPDNFADNFNADSLDVFYDNLDFSDLIANAAWSDTLSSLLLDPELPVIGLRESYRDGDSIVVEWDPWVYEEVKGYEIYLTEIPFDNFPHQGVVPPWIKPDTVDWLASVGNTYHYSFNMFDPYKAYWVNVANRTAISTGDPGGGLILSSIEYGSPPVCENEYEFVEPGDPAVLEWTAPNGVDIDHFEIYKFADTEIVHVYHPFYKDYAMPDWYNLTDSFIVDNRVWYYYEMEPYASVDSGLNSFTDYDFTDGDKYIITAVDKWGFETQFSNTVSFYKMIPPDKDIVVLIPRIRFSTDFISEETIRDFYDSILVGYDYDFFMMSDSLKLQNCSTLTYDCIDWRDFAKYRLMIIEDGFDERDASLYEESEKGMTKFLASGRSMCNFGSLADYLELYQWDSSGTFPVENDFIRNYFAVDSVHWVTFRHYLFDSLPDTVTDTVFGFVSAEPTTAGMPYLDYDTGRYPFAETVRSFWPPEVAPAVSAFVPSPGGEVTHLYRSRCPETSILEGLPVGIKTSIDSTTTYLFGFHLWYMEYTDARQLIDLIMSGIPTDFSEPANGLIPDKFLLRQNYPNPFNSSTVISFALPLQTDVDLDIYNILGRKVRTLVDENKPAGIYCTIWDGRDDNDRPVASGVYFYRLKTSDFSRTHKMLYLK